MAIPIPAEAAVVAPPLALLLRACGALVAALAPAHALVAAALPGALAQLWRARAPLTPAVRTRVHGATEALASDAGTVFGTAAGVRAGDRLQRKKERGAGGGGCDSSLHERAFQRAHKPHHKHERGRGALVSTGAHQIKTAAAYLRDGSLGAVGAVGGLVQAIKPLPALLAHTASAQVARAMAGARLRAQLGQLAPTPRPACPALAGAINAAAVHATNFAAPQ